MPVIVEGTDKNAIAFDCSDDDFRSIDASLYQVLHRTTANECSKQEDREDSALQ